MASNNMSFNFSEMENCCQKLKSYLSEFDSNINYLKSNGIFPTSEWSGDAATNFNNGLNSYISSLVNLENVFMNVNKYLNQKITDYNTLDRLD